MPILLNLMVNLCMVFARSSLGLVTLQWRHRVRDSETIIALHSFDDCCAVLAVRLVGDAAKLPGCEQHQPQYADRIGGLQAFRQGSLKVCLLET